MKQIQSVNNQFIKSAKQLKSKKFRDKNGLFLIEGIRMLEEALASGYPLEYCLIAEGTNPVLAERVAARCPVFSVSFELLSVVCETENPQGIVAVARQRKTGLKDLDLQKDAFFAVVDGVQDPGNLGTIIRTAAAAGVGGMILTAGTVDVFNSKTVRASMGSIFYVPVVEGEDPKEVSRWLCGGGFKIVVGHVGAERMYYDLDYCGKLAIVVGNENHGPSEAFKEAGIPVKIPCKTESLNVSVAAALLLYERIRRGCQSG